MSKKIALFASGSGSNVENIINYFSNNRQVSFPLILCNKKEATVHQRAQKLGIPSVTFTKEQLENGEVLSLLKNEGIDFIVLAGFLLKMPENILNVYPDKIINIHPALLPKHGGKGMFGMNVHRAVVENKETESGITIHYVNSEYDKGAVILQKKCEVLPTDSPEDVAEKVHALEYEYFPKVIEQLLD